MEKSKTLYWTRLACGDWRLHMAAGPQGLCFVGSQDGTFEELADWADARLPGCALVRDEEKMRPYAAQLTEYLQGARDRFTVSFDLRGTPFQLAVWDALLGIPFGQTESYSDIANRIRKPSAARAVGAAIGANPLLIAVPCHRVLGKTGALTGYRGGLEMKKRLLQLERQAALAR